VVHLDAAITLAAAEANEHTLIIAEIRRLTLVPTRQPGSYAVRCAILYAVKKRRRSTPTVPGHAPWCMCISHTHRRHR
jgi:hypothetical protein